MDIFCRLYDFHVFNDEPISDGAPKKFTIQMFGKNVEGKTYSILVRNFKPFFFVLVPNGKRWDRYNLNAFIKNLKTKCGDGIDSAELIDRKKLYGFDGGQQQQFVKLSFSNTTLMNRVKNMWYYWVEDAKSRWGKRKFLKKEGYRGTRIYESNIPPLLRYFHIQNISPSGWVGFNSRDARSITRKKTTCDYEYSINYDNIHSVKKEESVPLIMCSFDIEASSSHGDFPLPKKSYKKLVMDILDYWDNHDMLYEDEEMQQATLRRIILTAFEMDDLTGIHKVFPKEPTRLNYRYINDRISKWLKEPVKSLMNGVHIEKIISETEESEESKWARPAFWRSKPRVKDTILDILNNTKYDRGDKLEDIDKTLVQGFPSLEGDKVTFIGSTFTRVGEKEPYLKHCVVLDTCDEVEGVETESYRSEAHVLLAWRDLLQREKPDVVLGYNIFGFDYPFMIARAEELDCKEEFVKISKNIDEICNIQKTSIKIASGVHELTYIAAPGMLSLDLYNYFRREVNLPSYKLDNVASHFIGDMIQSYTQENDATIFKSKNLLGLQNKNYIRFEEIGNSTEYYADGKKFRVFDVDLESGIFKIKGKIQPNQDKKIRWSLAKDDVSPQDIFKLSNGTAADRSVVATYCVMDCILTQLLAEKNDVLTGFTEMASICSVPISFIIMRGQGIKLLSFIGKKCRELGILMPDIPKGKADESYEGAICLPPKCNLYIDNPIACVDYSSLYPSSMISENLSHDSKVWTKEYDLEGNLLEELGSSKYDNLEDYEYVDVEYDTYRWIRKREGGREIKTKVGTKVCRFAQYPDNKLGVMPAILVELLEARKATRKLIKYKTLTTKDGEIYTGLLSSDNDNYFIKQKNGEKSTIPKTECQSIEDTYNDFMKNIFDKRQLGYKITANSVYGACGAKTSAFYEIDVAAATTATGRKLLIYAKNVIERVYHNRVCETSLGKVMTNAEVIYGDTDSCFFTFNLRDMDGPPITGKKALIITIELAQELGKLASSMLKGPHDLEYEKTLMPWALLSKKRYVGMQYEFDPNKCKRKSMGIVLKRRDNAPIVKEIYGGVIDILMKNGDVNKAIEFTRKFISDMIDEKFPMRKLIVTKSLRGFYKNPKTIAHKVLAERMGKRDPGTKPSIGSRVPFAYIQTKRKVKLQGERIEHPDFITKNNLKLDYVFYITNQIMKPIMQIFALESVMNNIPKFQRRRRQFYTELATLKQQFSEEDYKKKELKRRNKEVEVLIFEDLLRKANNLKNGHQNIKNFFTKF